MLESVEKIEYDGKDFKIDELKEFLFPLARYEKKDISPSGSPSGDFDDSEQGSKKAYEEIFNEKQFNSNILDTEKAALVFFILSPNVTSAVPMFGRILREVSGPLQVGVFYLNESSPDFAEDKKRYKLGAKFPQMRFYPCNQYGEDKSRKSHEIFLSKNLDDIMEEVHEAFDHDVRETSEKILTNIVSSVAMEDRKNIVIYFYNEDRVSLHIKALSTLPVLKDDYVFMSVSSPSQQLLETFQVKQLPNIAGVLAPSAEDPTNMRQFAYGGSINFDEILMNLWRVLGKQDDITTRQKQKKRASDRKLEEITSTAKFRQNCLEREKGCAIAFLNGNQLVRILQLTVLRLTTK